MPSYRHHEPGDLYVRIQVQFPDRIDPAVVPALESALPPRKPVEDYKVSHVDEVDLSELDARQQREQASRGDAMDEDEEGQPRVQCANQ